MKRLIIIGAGAFGREVLNWALDIPSADRDWEVGGFLDSDPDALRGYDCSYPVLGDEKDFRPLDGDCFVCSIGSPGVKMEVCEPLLARGAEFVTIIHPRATVGHRTRLGPGCIICPGAILTTDVTLGALVAVNINATVGHDVSVGDACTISPNVSIGGFASLGKGVFVGSNAVVLPSAVVGDRATVGAGSVVLKTVQPGATAFGVPARSIPVSPGGGRSK